MQPERPAWWISLETQRNASPPAGGSQDGACRPNTTGWGVRVPGPQDRAPEVTLREMPAAGGILVAFALSGGQEAAFCGQNAHPSWALFLRPSAEGSWEQTQCAPRLAARFPPAYKRTRVPPRARGIHPLPQAHWGEGGHFVPRWGCAESSGKGGAGGKARGKKENGQDRGHGESTTGRREERSRASRAASGGRGAAGRGPPGRWEAMADIDKLNIDSIIQRLLEGEGRRGAVGAGGCPGRGRVWGPAFGRRGGLRFVLRSQRAACPSEWKGEPMGLGLAAGWSAVGTEQFSEGFEEKEDYFGGWAALIRSHSLCLGAGTSRLKSFVGFNVFPSGTESSSVLLRPTEEMSFSRATVFPPGRRCWWRNHSGLKIR